MITGLYSTLLGDICTNVFKSLSSGILKVFKIQKDITKTITISFLQDSPSHTGIKSDGFSQTCTTVMDYCFQQCDVMQSVTYDGKSNEKV
jgi:hypothetical protein